MRGFLAEQGTLAQFSCPGAHAQNGVAERKHRHLLETARVLMIVASLPPHFWAEAVSASTYLINIQPSTALQGGIPTECLTGRSPDYSSLRMFGCVCYVLLAPRERTKLTVGVFFLVTVMNTRAIAAGILLVVTYASRVM